MLGVSLGYENVKSQGMFEGLSDFLCANMMQTLHFARDTYNPDFDFRFGALWAGHSLHTENPTDSWHF